jgi:hypothetical protein
MKYFLLVAIVILLAVGAWFALSPNTTDVANEPAETAEPTRTEMVETEPEPETDDAEMDTAPAMEPVVAIGRSREGRDIEAYRFGTGEADVLIVGGIHGAYAPNTNALAERVIQEARTNPNFVPEGVTLHVVPNLNPDGLATGESPAGRFNAEGVDLNRNFDCEWQPEGTWQNRAVSGGGSPFSEPEAASLRDYVRQVDPEAAIVYYSAAGGVYASNCRNGVSDATLELTNTYADATDYSANEEFDFYEITGDAVNWMASESVPAISVLLSNYTSTEWEQNRAGLVAVMDVFAE